MTNKENSNVILSQEGRIQSYTNESVKRGLNLANKLFINSRSKINQEVTEQYTKKQNHQWNHFCKINHPKGKITSVSISSEDNLIGVIDSWSTFNFFALKDETFSLSHDPFLGHYKKFSDFNILNYDQSEAERCNSFKKHGENFNIVVVEKSQKLISIKNYEIKIWNFKNRTLESKISSVYNPLVNTLNKIIVYENNDANIQVWSIDKDRIISEIETDFDSIEHISLSGDGKQLAVSGLKTVGGDHEKDEYINEHSIKIWNISINSFPIQVNKFIDTKNIIRSPKIYLDEKGKVLVSVDNRDFFGSNLFSIGVWDLISENLLYQLELNDDFIIATKKEHLIHISEEDNNKIIVRDLTTGKIIQVIQNEDTRIFNVSCDGEVIACASSENVEVHGGSASKKNLLR